MSEVKKYVLFSDYEALQKKFDAFVRDSGTTCVPCPECGHGMTSKEGCLYCEAQRLRLDLAEIRDHDEFLQVVVKDLRKRLESRR